MSITLESISRYFRFNSFAQDYLRFLFALAAGVGALLVGEFVYLKEFLTTDENSYLFQAWLFLQGKISLDSPPAREAFFHRMLINDEHAGWLSRYPPAHSLWLVPGVAMGYSRLMVAVAAFISVWFLCKAGERLKISNIITAGLLLASPYFWLMQGSLLSHTSALAATAIMVWAYIAWQQDGKINYAAFAGLAWAFLFLNRTFTALLIVLPFAVDSILRLNQARSWSIFLGVVLFASCSASGILSFLFYNWLITGDPLLATYLYYNKLDGLGFGVRHAPGVLHTLEIGMGFVKANISTLNVRLWGFTGSLFIWLLLSIIGWKKSITPLLLSGILLVWSGYVAFWFPGIAELAPVYYYETLVFIVLSAGLGINCLLTTSWRIPPKAVALVCLALVFLVGKFAVEDFYLNAIKIVQRHTYKSAYQSVIRDVPDDSIVLLDSLPKDILDETSWNPHGLKSDPLVVREVYGIQHVLYHLFPDKAVYKVKGHTPRPAKNITSLNGQIPALNANSMRATTGQKMQSGERVFHLAQQSDHSQGVLGYGVKQYLIPGTYQIKFYLNATGVHGEIVGQVDVAANSAKEILLKRQLISGDDSVVFEVSVDKVTLIEPRVHFSGKGSLVFDRVEINLLDKA